MNPETWRRSRKSFPNASAWHQVLPPDVNKSEGGFSIVTDENGKEEIRFGLYTIKNLGVDIADAIINERKANGPYTSFESFIRRVTHKNLNKKSLEALTMCGALDELGDRGRYLQTWIAFWHSTSMS
jgi:DNA polymerase-3 subunit alpha